MEPISFDKPVRPGAPAGTFDPGSGAGADDAVFGDVGEFRLGSPLSQWALARYLVGRSIASSIGAALWVVLAVVVALAVVLWLALDAHVWAILVGVVALFVLLFRTLLMGLLNRLTAARQYRPLEDRLRTMVGDTRTDVLAELRRIGLPGRIWSLPLLAVRLLRRRSRAATVESLRLFQLERVVPPGRVDELHLLLNQAVGR